MHASAPGRNLARRPRGLGRWRQFETARKALVIALDLSRESYGAGKQGRQKKEARLKRASR